MDATAFNQRINVEDSDGKTAQPSDGPAQLQINGFKLYRRGKRRVERELGAQAPCSSSSSSATCTQNSRHRGVRVAYKRRNPRFFVQRRASDVEAIAFPLGMSIAAVVAQVLERTDATWKEIPVNHLSMICTSAVRESLCSVFGDKFEPFARNFDKAFASTLKTLILVKGSSVENPKDHLNHFRFKDNNSGMTPTLRRCSWRSFDGNARQEESRRFDSNDCQMESFIPTVMPQEESSIAEDIQENQPTVTRELSLRALMDQERSCVSSNAIPYSRNNSTICTFEKSVVEQARANDLKAFEIGLTMQKLHLKKTQLALNSDSNFLERCKLSMGVSKASFQAEKFKTKMEDTRHAELIKNCIDCLVAGLLIMSGLIIYGTYVYSYKRIMEATSSCNPSTESSSSWWAIPKPMASFNSGLQTLRCQVQVVSRMLFGLLIILAIGYSIFQRAAAPKQTMPVTFILLLLGVGCGVAGKLCIDTLGGSGYHWLMYWELLCSLHFFVHMFTSLVFSFLYGPINVSLGTKASVAFPYWMRRVLFYLLALLVLPMLTGLLPFASLREWRNHCSSLVSNLLLAAQDED